MVLAADDVSQEADLEIASADDSSPKVAVGIVPASADDSSAKVAVGTVPASADDSSAKVAVGIMPASADDSSAKVAVRIVPDAAEICFANKNPSVDQRTLPGVPDVMGKRPAVLPSAGGRECWMPRFDYEMKENDDVYRFPVTVVFVGPRDHYLDDKDSFFAVDGTEKVDDLSLKVTQRLLNKRKASVNTDLYFFTKEETPLAIPSGTSMAAIFDRTAVLDLTCYVVDNTPHLISTDEAGPSTSTGECSCSARCT